MGWLAGQALIFKWDSDGDFEMHPARTNDARTITHGQWDNDARTMTGGLWDSCGTSVAQVPNASNPPQIPTAPRWHGGKRKGKALIKDFIPDRRRPLSELNHYSLAINHYSLSFGKIIFYAKAYFPLPFFSGGCF